MSLVAAEETIYGYARQSNSPSKMSMSQSPECMNMLFYIVKENWQM